MSRVNPKSREKIDKFEEKMEIKVKFKKFKIWLSQKEVSC